MDQSAIGGKDQFLGIQYRTNRTGILGAQDRESLDGNREMRILDLRNGQLLSGDGAHL